jgi:hypothetical protein
MSINKINIIYFFRYLWLALALILVIAVVFDSMSVKKTLNYRLNFHKSISPDITGWYPESRISQASFLSMDGVDLIAEPVYLKVYAPSDFSIMRVEGQISTYSPYSEQDIRLGLKQKMGDWDFKKITEKNFSLTYDLSEVKRYYQFLVCKKMLELA